MKLPFKDLIPGQTFRYRNDLFIKTEKVPGIDAVSVSDRLGRVVTIDEGEIVDQFPFMLIFPDD